MKRVKRITDTMRLNWLMKNYESLSVTNCFNRPKWYTSDVSVLSNSPRQAIDFEIKKSPLPKRKRK